MSKEISKIGSVVAVLAVLLGVAFSFGYTLNTVDNNTDDIKKQEVAMKESENRKDRIELAIVKLTLLLDAHDARIKRLEKE